MTMSTTPAKEKKRETIFDRLYQHSTVASRGRQHPNSTIKHFTPVATLKPDEPPAPEATDPSPISIHESSPPPSTLTPTAVPQNNESRRQLWSELEDNWQKTSTKQNQLVVVPTKEPQESQHNDDNQEEEDERQKDPKASLEAEQKSAGDELSVEQQETALFPREETANGDGEQEQREEAKEEDGIETEKHNEKGKTSPLESALNTTHDTDISTPPQSPSPPVPAPLSDSDSNGDNNNNEREKEDLEKNDKQDEIDIEDGTKSSMETTSTTPQSKSPPPPLQTTSATRHDGGATSKPTPTRPRAEQQQPPLTNFVTPTNRSMPKSRISTPYSNRYWKLTFTPGRKDGDSSSSSTTQIKSPITGISFGTTLHRLEQGLIDEQFAATVLISALFDRDHGTTTLPGRNHWEYDPAQVAEEFLLVGDNPGGDDDDDGTANDPRGRRRRWFRAHKDARNDRSSVATARGRICFDPPQGEICVHDYSYSCSG